MGAFLHDVGKTGIPAEILNKPGPLSPEEWVLMKQHTIMGDQLLSTIEFPWDVRPMVRGHHERWDGTGYPDGLAGETIPLTARILCIADVFDALTTRRPYRAPSSREQALEIMRRDAGRMFDPELLARFEALLAAQPGRRKPAGASTRRPTLVDRLSCSESTATGPSRHRP
jgi:HD-GYP domain-containing protein (c-di-GMP phosphodiesterase class II)